MCIFQISFVLLMNLINYLVYKNYKNIFDQMVIGQFWPMAIQDIIFLYLKQNI